MSTTASATDIDFLDAVHSGLSRSPKQLPCRFFYDLEGSLLFEEICDLPEYYLTRAEDQILRDHADAIAAALPAPLEVVELGSGSSRKTRRLVEALLRKQSSVRYVPVDISAEMLRRSAAALLREYPRLTVVPVVGEYTAALEELRASAGGPRLALFLGSNLGNFDREDAMVFLRRIRQILTPQGRALVGLDLDKDPALLNAAYDDAHGVTARFNLNLLKRINRELGADFALKQFKHSAVYNREAGRVEMYLVSRSSQAVRIAGRTFHFEAGETIHTESSYKYTRNQIGDLARDSGFRLERTWLDSSGLFSLNLLGPG